MSSPDAPIDTHAVDGHHPNALAFVFVTVLLSMIGLGIIIPVMPDLIMDLTGTDRSGAARLGGYLLTAFAVTQFFMSPFLGALSDRFGRRPVILISLFSYAIDFALMALAPTYAWLFIGRVISGACAATFATANAYIADVSTPEKRAANFGLMGAAFGLGFIIGPLIGGIAGEFGHRWPFAIACILTLINFTFGYFVLPETLTEENRRKFQWSRANPVGGLLSMARYPVVIGVLFAFFLMQFAHNSLPAVWAYFTGEKFGWTALNTGMSLAYVGVTAAFVQGYLTRKVIPAIGEVKAVSIGIAAMVVSFMGYAFFTPTGAYVYFWVTVGALGGFIMPGMQGIMSKATPANEQGELQGAVASLMSMTLVASPFIMTQVFAQYTDDAQEYYFPGAPWLLSAVVLGASAIPFLQTMRRVDGVAQPANTSEEAP
ncbi:MAG: TCR/Tet family MFS transporter [Pseudomonadota bacterium]